MTPPDGMSRRLRIAIVIPVYDDWASLAVLLDSVDHLLQQDVVTATVVIINDQPGSGVPGNWCGAQRWTAIEGAEVLHLTRNLGHQRAIAVGLSHVDQALDCDAVAVMDADGEDRPEDLAQLIRHFRGDPARIVVAERCKRSEGPLFVAGYWIYKSVFRLLTGKTVSFGNFCLIPRRLLTSIASMNEIWSNFPAGLIQSKLPLHRLATSRGTRYHGRSSMNLVALIMHGLGAISVFSDAVFVRVTLFSGCLLALMGAAVAGVVGLKLTGHATPGWASNVALSLTVLALQMVMLSGVAAFMVLNNRSFATVIPRLNYRNFVLHSEALPVGWRGRARASGENPVAAQ